MVEPVELHTERLVLSTPVAADIDAITAACQDPLIQRWTTVPSPYTRTDAENFVNAFVTAGWQSATTRTWAIRRRDDEGERLVGMAGLESIRDGSGEIGYWLVPSARRERIMSEAVAAVLDHGFDPAGVALDRIQWRAYAGNVPSARVARTAGFRFEGTRRLGAAGRDGRQDEWTAAILVTDDRSPAEGWPAETLGA
jgi:RimJ/RimL family protein N-acetyltransferase